MARRSRQKDSLNATAESIGAALGRVAARLDHWKQQRVEIARDLNDVVSAAKSLLGELGETASEVVERAKAQAGKGGRPKGFRVSDATRRKLRAAWKRRKRAAAKPAPAE